MCRHEEADTRILLHVVHAVNSDISRIMVRTVDMDVVGLCIANVQLLNLDELWVAFGTGKNLRYIPTHSVAQSLGPDKCAAIHFFHAVTGCYTDRPLSVAMEKRQPIRRMENESRYEASLSSSIHNANQNHRRRLRGVRAVHCAALRPDIILSTDK
jgi:hypothetical protein